MMKILNYILLVYVLVLTVIPCVDVPNDDNLHKTELATSSSNEHEHDADHCSPFCTCDCCVSPIVSNSSIHFTFTPIAQKLLTEYNNSFVSPLFTSIWQPPKLS